MNPPVQLPAKRRKIGAPTECTAQLAAEIIEAVQLGTPITHCAQAARVSFETLCAWRRRDSDFDAAIRTAIATGIQERLKVVRDCMASEDESVRLRAATWWLSHSPESARYFSESSKLELDGELDTRVLALVWPHRIQDENSISDDSVADAPSVTG
jgi:transposase-like protein